MVRNYGRYPGEKGKHFMVGDAELEVIHCYVMDNNCARYRVLDGPRAGKEFDATAEHFDPTPGQTRPE